MSLTPDAPAGFRAAAIQGDFIVFNGLFFGRLADAQLQLGFRVGQRHTHPLGICHGGLQPLI